MGRKYLKNLDLTLLVTALLIVLFGLVAISSATHATAAQGEDPFGFVKKQVFWIILGLVVLWAVQSFDYRDLSRYAVWLYGFNLLMLAGVLLVGSTRLGAQRWFALGPFMLQPSEFSKVIVIVTLATLLAKREGQLGRLRDLLLPMAFTAVPVLLILKQPDLGTALVLTAILLGMLYMAGARPSHLAGLVLTGLVVIGGMLGAHVRYGTWIPLKEYQVTRLLIFLDPWQDWQGAGYHVIQSQIAIGSGGPWGRGLYNGSQNQLNFLPEQHTDFIFSVVGEELGFVGALVLLILYFILLYRGIRIAAQARDTMGVLIATGIVFMLAFHILVNVGMTIGIMPVTGVPLPLFSYGGSAMLTNMAALGLLLNVYRRQQRIIF
ncbi:MAG: rod shape-determining protein RodA [Desulfotomaculales bacterium]